MSHKTKPLKTSNTVSQSLSLLMSLLFSDIQMSQTSKIFRITKASTAIYTTFKSPRPHHLNKQTQPHPPNTMTATSTPYTEATMEDTAMLPPTPISTQPTTIHSIPSQCANFQFRIDSVSLPPLTPSSLHTTNLSPPQNSINANSTV
jgi:hypothetical protein